MRTARLLSLAFAVVSLGACQSEAITPQEPDPPGPALTVAPSYAAVGGGQIIRLTATVAQPNGSRTAAENVRWSSADASIATVAQDGTVHALKPGRVQIVAEWQASRGSSLIVVTDPVSKKGGCPVNLEGGPGTSALKPCA